jgi:hypothetical protein
LKSLSIILLLFASGCGCNWHLKKVKAKCGFDTETITVTDTIRVSEVRKDSLFFYNQKDTVIIQRDNLQIKYFYSNDSVYINGTCKEVTVIKERVVTVNKYKPKENYWYLWVISFLLGVILLKRFKLL